MKTLWAPKLVLKYRISTKTKKYIQKAFLKDIFAIGRPTWTDVNLGSVCLLFPTLTLRYHGIPRKKWTNFYRP